VIDGVATRVVEDRGYLNNVLEERTSDYYAQDRCGNVWYFGEDTATLDRHGRVVDTEVFKAIDHSAPVTVPYGSFRHALRTAETTALEPGIVDNKYYVRGVGEVAELAVRGPREEFELVEIIS
jgi:hypothetical protein